jgi:hypothetical protein
MLTSLLAQSPKAGGHEARLAVRQGRISRLKPLPVTFVE